MINLFADEGKSRNSFYNVKSKVMISSINITYITPHKEGL